MFLTSIKIEKPIPNFLILYIRYFYFYLSVLKHIKNIINLSNNRLFHKKKKETY